MFNYQEILACFKIRGNVINCERYGNGHINDTYKVTSEFFEETNKYILQRINHKVFTNIEGLMKNQELVTSHIAGSLLQSGKYEERLCLSLVFTTTNNSYLKAGGDFYRCYQFIDGGVCLDSITEPHQFELAGIGFGRFQKYLDGFPAEKLFDVIPNFHNTIERYKQLEKAVEENLSGKADACKDIINEFLSRKNYTERIVKALESGEIPTRVTHNDTKLNNVLIDTILDEPLAVLDLDTVMPGSIVYDFGDSIRFGANTAAEDEQDLSRVNFSMELFEAFTKGFMSEVKDILTSEEIASLAFGAILMTYECGMRFLADHLNGDTYFRIHRENHNLDRAKTQLKMVQDMEKVLPQMDHFVRSFYNGTNKG